MKLWVVRHAAAADAAGETTEAARPLTSEGRERFEAVVRGLARLEPDLDVIVHSPLLRAVQTAELLVPLLHGETRVSAHSTRAPSNELLAELEGERVALVGHEPWLSELIALLVTGQRDLGPRFALGKGGVAELEGRALPGEMTLVWMYPVETFARSER